ncbi:hypothetical protein ACQKWADRAFT_291701 [Trichoderma austrokoningii]
MATENLPKPDAVKTFHKKPYAAISPLRPELSQKGRVVYVTGGSAGIGLAICHAFATAGAATVILTARREGPLNEAVKTLSKEHPDTKFIGQPLDATDRAATDKAWAQLESDGVVVEVLVLNAAHIPDKAASVLELGYKDLWPSFVTNVGANLDLIDRFYHQKKRAAGQKLSLVNISTMAIHHETTVKTYGGYGATKNAGTMTVQMIARGVSPDDMQVLSFHPGAVYTASVAKAGVPESVYEWDDANLPGHYAVWATSEEAKFLHGRFTWAAWDVEELTTEESKKKIEEDEAYLRVGVIGL